MRSKLVSIKVAIQGSPEHVVRKGGAECRPASQQSPEGPIVYSGLHIGGNLNRLAPWPRLIVAFSTQRF